MKITVFQWLQEEKLLLNEKLAENVEDPAERKKAALKEKQAERDENLDRKSTRLNSSHSQQSRMPSSA